MSDYTNPDSDDSKGYESPKAEVNKYFPRIIERKIPLDDYHLCPCCEGKGYVGIYKRDNK